MLEAVVEKMELRSELFLGENSRSVTGFPDDDRNIQTPCHEQRFVAEIMGRARWVYQQHAVALASVAPGEDIEFQATGFQQLSQQEDKGRFARSADGEVADTNHRALQPLGASEASLIKCVTGANPESEE